MSSNFGVETDCVFGLAGTCGVIGKPVDNIYVAVTVWRMSDMVHSEVIPLSIILCANRFAKVLDRYGSR